MFLFFLPTVPVGLLSRSCYSVELRVADLFRIDGGVSLESMKLS